MTSVYIKKMINGEMRCMIRKSDRVCELCGKKIPTKLLSRKEIEKFKNDIKNEIDAEKFFETYKLCIVPNDV